MLVLGDLALEKSLFLVSPAISLRIEILD